MIENEIIIKLAKSDKFGAKAETIREHTDQLLKQAERLYELKYIDRQEYSSLRYACEKHDYGKANDSMQKRLTSKSKRFDESKEVQHNILSALFVNKENFQTDEEEYLAVLYAVLYHHDNRMQDETLASILKRCRESSEEPRDKLINDFINKYDGLTLDRKAFNKIDKIMSIRDCDEIDEVQQELLKKLVKMKGLLHKCDYSASAHIACEYPNDFLVNKLESLCALFKGWNELQLFSIDNQDKNMIVTAPTGSGKTEAGLLWAGNHKCFFILPLKAAINAIYDRIKIQILKEENISERVALLHSDVQSYYLNHAGESNVDIEEVLSYVLRSKQMSLPITVATLDQLFDFTLKYYAYEYKLVTLSYSKIIIDEIQMYSPELLAYLIYGIKKIVEMGGKVAIFTATLSPYVKKMLEHNIGSDLVDRNFSSLIGIRHRVKIIESQLNSLDIIKKWNDFSDRDSRKFLVICNCVKTAKRIFDELSEGLGDSVEIHLLHAHFTRADRAKKEDAIKKVGETYNQDGTRNKAHQIWVTTSVVEASLDIDFDYLFTELLELMSLFQRLGRENRKGIKPIVDYNCFVYTNLQDDPLKYYNKEDGFKFVDNDIYDLSKKAILTVDGVLDETKKKDLIDEYMSVENLEKTGYAKKFEKAYKQIGEYYLGENKQKPIREIDNIDIIPFAVYENNQECIDGYEQIILNNQINNAERMKAIDGIREFIVGVSLHRIRIGTYGKKRTRHLKDIIISKYIKIPIIYCEYDDIYGLGAIEEEENATTKFI